MSLGARILSYVRSSLDDDSLTSAGFAFVLSRVIVILIFVFGTSMTFREPITEFGARIQVIDASVSHGMGENLRRGIAVADSLWQIDIARYGYERIPFDNTVEHNWAFFPLSPLLIRAAAKLTGEFVLTGAALSTLLFFPALFFLYKTAIAFGLDPNASGRATFYTAIFPTSYFFSLPVSESLFLLLTVTAVLAAKRDRWWLACALGGLASATRFFGILLLPVLFILYLQEQEKRASVRLLALLLVPMGLLAYMWHLRNITGNALAFSAVQAAWKHRPAFFTEPLLAYLLNPANLNIGWNFIFLNFLAAVLALVAGVIMIKQRRWALAFYTLASILIPLSYPSSPLQSVTRYVMVVFPVFMVLAEKSSSGRTDQTIRAVFIALLSLMTLFYSIHFSPALS
jgi:Mannosyltransferase (PIG-V)